MSKESDRNNQAVAWARSVAYRHVGSNIRKAKVLPYTRDPLIGTLGQFDLKPQEGKVVELSNNWILLKTSLKEFFVAETELLEFIPEVGSKVIITPYARRRFDGMRLDDPISSDGFGRVYHLTASVSHITTLPKSEFKTHYLQQLVEQLEVLPMRDGYRKISQAMIDYGALEGVEVDNPSDGEMSETFCPAIRFRVKTGMLDGWLQIKYLRWRDTYSMQTLSDDKAVIMDNVDDVYFDDLGERIAELVDDDTWLIAKVEIKQHAKTHKTA